MSFPLPDLEVSNRFYSAVFGWKFEDYGPEYASFHDGRLAGGFTTRIPVPVQGVLVVIYCGDLDALREDTRGGRHDCQGHVSFPGGRRFHFADTNGYALAVWSDQ